jgi:Asp-tRNA(Asn)/Glu-tRNA(Gln) amidotransferase A subunit family amidase
LDRHGSLERPLSVSSILSFLLRGRGTVTDVVDEAFRRIAAHAESTNAYVDVLSGSARGDARSLDTRRVALSHSRLLGVPVAVKAAFDLSGHVTTGCSDGLIADVAARDADVVAHLRSEGAIVVAVTNQHELGAGATGLISSNGPVRNPFDPTTLAGGSSSGSAVAVATHACPIAIGSDTGGSIRIPASFCGCWGLKPSDGTIGTVGMLPLAPSLDCVGILGASLSDVARAWSVLAGTPYAPKRPRRVGTLRGEPWDAHDRRASDALAAAERTFRDGGASVVNVDGGTVEDATRVWNGIVWPEFERAYRGSVIPSKLHPVTASLMRWGEANGERRRPSLLRRRAIADWFLRQFEDVDLLISATTPYGPPTADAREVHIGGDRMIDVHEGGPARLTTPVNLAGLPALSVPHRGATPIGVQLIGPPHGEDWVLAAGELLETDDRFGLR